MSAPPVDNKQSLFVFPVIVIFWPRIKQALQSEKEKKKMLLSFHSLLWKKGNFSKVAEKREAISLKKTF